MDNRRLRYAIGTDYSSYYIEHHPRTENSNTRNLTYGCEFGYHIDCGVEGCYTSDPDETGTWGLASVTVVCVDGLWTVLG